MKNYPDNSQSIPVPSWFFHEVMQEIKDVDQLKIILLVMYMIRRKRRYQGFITFDEICNDVLILKNVSGSDNDAKYKIIQKALYDAIQYGMLLAMNYKKEERLIEVYFINTVNARNTIDKVIEGKIALQGIDGKVSVNEIAEDKKNIFTLYEQNIGMLTPLISDQLQIAEKTYPEEWIKDAFKEAVALNKRNWRYIQRILENWTIEGKSDGKYRRNIKKEKDPDRFIKGRYGHMVQR